MNNIFAVCFALFLCLMPFVSVSAQESDNIERGAVNFVQDMGDQAIGFLSDDALSIEKKAQSFRRLLKSKFDLRTIGRFALGRYWRVANAEQQREYQALFEDLIVRVYSNRFNNYNGQNFVVDTARFDGKKDTLVTSYIVPDNGGAKVRVDWRVRYKDGSYSIVDVVVEGVSMAVNQRSDFSSIIQRNGGDINALIDHMRNNVS